jgi:hypothetical protein
LEEEYRTVKAHLKPRIACDTITCITGELLNLECQTTWVILTFEYWGEEVILATGFPREVCVEKSHITEDQYEHA